MTRDITRSVLRAVCTEGAVLPAELLRATLPLVYQKAAGEMVQRYAADAAFNNLEYDLDAEQFSVELFAEALAEAGTDFAEAPLGTPAMPSWQRLAHVMPDAAGRLAAAAELSSPIYCEATA